MLVEQRVSQQILVERLGRPAWALIVVRGIPSGELMLTAAAAAQAWTITEPHPAVAAMAFYQALIEVAPKQVWSGAWWLLTAMAAIGMACAVAPRQCGAPGVVLALRRLTMALFVFAWWFTGMVEWDTDGRLGLLAPFGFVFTLGALWTYWRLNVMRRIDE